MYLEENNNLFYLKFKCVRKIPTVCLGSENHCKENKDVLYRETARKYEA